MIIDNIKKLLLGIAIVSLLLLMCMTFDYADEISNLNESSLPKDLPKDCIIVDNGSIVANDSLSVIKVKSSDLVQSYPVITMTGKPSCSCSKRYSYKWYTRSYINYCPYCHRYGTLYNAHKFQARFEKEISCKRCSSDWCIVCGKEKMGWSKRYLRKC